MKDEAWNKLRHIAKDKIGKLTTKTDQRAAWICAAEFLMIAVYSIYRIVNYQEMSVSYVSKEMFVQEKDGDVEKGNYLDTTFENAKAVVTPVIFLKKGVYDISFSYDTRGIVKAGLIYDVARNGHELVDEEEFTINPGLSEMRYRATIKEDMDVGFKLRLTGDAQEGDYIKLERMSVSSSRLGCVYHIFLLVMFIVMLDCFLLWYRYGGKIQPRKRAILYGLSAIIILCGMPLYQKGLPYGVDLTFHLQRMEGVYKGLLGGMFPVRVQPGWLNDHGYAASVFYGDVFLYLPAVLRMIGFTLQDAFKVYIFAVIAGTAVISFFSFKRIFKDDVAALTGTLLYAGSYEHLYRYYSASHVGAFSAMMFYPLVVLGLHRLLAEDFESADYNRTWIYLTTAFSGLLLTHMISCLMVGLFTALVCIICAKRVLRIGTLREIGKAVCAWFFVNLWFLLPFFQFMGGDYRITENLQGMEANADLRVAFSDFTQSALSLSEIFLDKGLGIVCLLVILLYIFHLPFAAKRSETAGRNLCFGLTVFAIWLCTEAFPILVLLRIPFLAAIFKSIQYQDRFLSIASILLAVSGCYLTADLKEKKETYILVMLLYVSVLCQDVMYFRTITADRIYLDTVDLLSWTGNDGYSYGIGNGEYLPSGVDLTNMPAEIWYDEQNIRVKQADRECLKYECEVENISESEQMIALPLLYYEGYWSVDGSGKVMNTFCGENKRVTVSIPAGYKGTFVTQYSEFWYWRMAEAVSLLTVVLIVWRLCGNYQDKASILYRRKIRSEDN